MSRGTKTRLAEYCESNGIPEASLVEYLVEAQLDKPLDEEAYAKYRARAEKRARLAQVAGGRRSPGRPYAHLFKPRCRSCRQPGHYTSTCPEARP